MSDLTPKQICPAPTCGMPIHEYRQDETPDALDLFCPYCDEHVAHLERETLRQLWEMEHE